MSRVAPERAAGLPSERAVADCIRCTAPRRSVCALAVALAVALAPAIGAATVYKWVDASGRVFYSDQPPPANVKSEVVKPAPPPANPAAAQELIEREQADRQREKKRKDESKVADKVRVDYERKREICVNALAQQKMLQERKDILYRFNEKGEKVLLSDDMKREEVERLQQIVRENCPG